jgi:hypothetical protein
VYLPTFWHLFERGSLGDDVLNLDAAKARVQSLAEMCPGQYVIYDEEMGERVALTSGGQSH